MSISLALGRTPAKAARPDIRGWCLSWHARLLPSFCWQAYSLTDLEQWHDEWAFGTQLPRVTTVFFREFYPHHFSTFLALLCQLDWIVQCFTSPPTQYSIWETVLQCQTEMVPTITIVNWLILSVVSRCCHVHFILPDSCCFNLLHFAIRTVIFCA